MRNSAGAGQLRTYLQAQFKLKYEPTDELRRLSSQDELALLTKRFERVKQLPKLAKNDATLALAVYGRRAQRGELSRVSDLGYRTWWLTEETHILEESEGLINNHEGAPYMMRPVFLLNFLALAPSSAEVRETYRTIFPTMLGIRLGKRMEGTEYDKLMRSVGDTIAMEEGRLHAAMGEMSNRLKGYFASQFKVDPDVASGQAPRRRRGRNRSRPHS